MSQQQGVLHAHQLDHQAADTAGSPSPVEVPRPTLSALLHEPFPDLPPVHACAFEPVDTALDPEQREAVGRALATPDVFLIQGLPGTGKSRVAAEILTQAVARGERVLLLAASAAGLDRILDVVAENDTLCALRCLSPEETPEALPPNIRRLTFPERLRLFEEQTLRAAREAVQSRQERHERCLRDEALWPRLEELLARQQAVLGQLQHLQERQAGLAGEIEAEASDLAATSGRSAFQGSLAAFEQAHAEALAGIDARLAANRAEDDKARAEQANRERELAHLGTLTEAREHKRWWTLAFWQASFQGETLSGVDPLRQHCEELQQAIDRLATECGALADERSRVENQHQGNVARLRQEELTRRQAELDAELAGRKREQQQLQAQWQAACQEFSIDPRSSILDPRSSIQPARESWRQRCIQEEQELALARQWLAGVEAAWRTLPERLPGLVNVVASTTIVPANPHPGDRAARATAFDLVLLDEADQVAEADFLALAQHARRWVLIGSPVPEADAEHAERKPTSAPVRTQPSRSPRGVFFLKLWRQLHTDPRRLPYQWQPRDSRLSCVLQPVRADQQRWIQSERVADRPDIELRILSVPRQPPQLVEVIFPAPMTIHEAKEYLFRELEELTVQAHGPGLRWLEKPGQVILRLASAASSDARPVPLERGVRELVGSFPATPLTLPSPPGGEGRVRGGAEEAGPPRWQTCCLEFDRESGWDRARAEQWVDRHLGLRNLGRTALLTVPHRMQPGLARWLSEVALDGGYQCDDLATSERTVSVEFVSVTGALAASEPRRRGEDDGRRRGGGTATATTRVRTPRGGAGLEVDLADSRRLDQLPAELRAVLPGQGLINYVEAQAVVRMVETLLADPAFAAEAVSWQQRHVATGGSPVAVGRLPVLAVMALYPGQVELLRRLLRRLPQPANPVCTVEVGLPLAFRQREGLAALVSLTRSHTHRAVAYGESPEVLVQALTRAARRLILFGDPGTLLRRSQWPGAVDHLDESAAGRERRLLSQLAHAVQGDGPAAQVFRLHEGGSL